MKLYTITELQEIKEKMQLTRTWNGLQDWIDYAKELAGQLDRATDTAIEAARERDSLRAGIAAIIEELHYMAEHSDYSFCRSDAAGIEAKARKLLEVSRE